MATTMAVRYLPDGSIRSLWHDPLADHRRAQGFVPRRASQVFAIADGPHAGRFAVDFSPLGESFQFCLTETFSRYGDAVKAEQAWLHTHWVAAPLDGSKDV